MSLHRAVTRYQAGDYVGAVRQCTELAWLSRTTPKLIQALEWRASSLDSLERLLEALADCNRILMLDPGYATVYHTRAYLCNKCGRHQEALEMYQQALCRGTPNASWFNNTGYAFHHLRKFNDALENYDRSLELDQNYALAYANRGFTLYLMGRRHQSEADLLKAITLISAGMQTQRILSYVERIKRGRALYFLHRINEALEDFASAIALRPHSAEPLAERGCVLYRLERYEEAQVDLDRAWATNTLVTTRIVKEMLGPEKLSELFHLPS